MRLKEYSIPYEVRLRVEMKSASLRKPRCDHITKIVSIPLS